MPSYPREGRLIIGPQQISTFRHSGWPARRRFEELGLGKGKGQLEQQVVGRLVHSSVSSARASPSAASPSWDMREPRAGVEKEHAPRENLQDAGDVRNGVIRPWKRGCSDFHTGTIKMTAWVPGSGLTERDHTQRQFVVKAACNIPDAGPFNSRCMIPGVLNADPRCRGEPFA